MPQATHISYSRRRPEKTLLYQAVQESWRTLAAVSDRADRPLPNFVQQEFQAYLECGILAFGFVRVHCQGCGHDRLVAFSCKGRGFCPSCGGRFMAHKSAHLLDNVFPKVPVRQWVLTLPPPLRYLLAYDASLCSEVLACFMQAIFASLKHLAKRELGLSSVKCAYPGSVTAIQRSGSALNLNIHFHTLATDGVFVRQAGDKEPTFHALPAPSIGEITAVAWATCQRVTKILRKRGIWLDVNPDDDALAQQEPALAELCGASLQGIMAMGPNKGQRLVRFYGAAACADQHKVKMQTPGYGFNLHAARRVAADDRAGLERLCRYILRPPLSNDRLKRLDNGKLSLRLKRAWSDGTTHLIFTPLELVAKLVPLIWAPKINRLRYHGCFAPNAKIRSLVVPAPKQDAECAHDNSDADNPHQSDSTNTSSHRQGYTWAKMMARIFDIDVKQCPICGSQMQRIAFIMRPDAIRKILDSVGFPADSPVAAPPVFEQEEMDWGS